MFTGFQSIISHKLIRWHIFLVNISVNQCVSQPASSSVSVVSLSVVSRQAGGS